MVDKPARADDEGDIKDEGECVGSVGETTLLEDATFAGGVVEIKEVTRFS